MTRKNLFFIIIFGLFFAFISLIGYQSYIIPQILHQNGTVQEHFNRILMQTILLAFVIWIIFSAIQLFLILHQIKNKTQIFFQEDIDLKQLNKQKAYNDILQLYRSATTDKKTGVMLFKPFMALVEKEVIRGRRYTTPFTMGKIILNNKKNKESLLHKVTHNLKTTLREIDSISITDNQEILILLPNIKKHNGFLAMKRVMKRMHHIEEAINTKIQLSIGIASFPEDGNEINDIFKILDQRIQKSKLLGDNTIIY